MFHECGCCAVTVQCSHLLLAPAPDAIRRFLTDVVRDNIHLVAITLDGRIRGKWFGDDIEAAVAWACAENRAGKNVYFTANVCKPTAGNKPSKREIKAARFAYVDIDPPKSGGSLDRDLTLAQLHALEIKPSVIIDSGNGIQALWRLSPHVEEWAPVEDLNKELARRLGGDDCHNIDRLLRLPGTVNYPDQKKAARGCIPVLASVIHAAS